MDQPRILRFDEIPPVSRGAGVVTRPLVGSWIGAQRFTSGITTFPPGAAIRVHTHNVEEMVVILEGEARCDVAGQSHQLRQFDATYVPADVPHRFVNTGDQPMSILWTYATAHVTRTFADTGETVDHLSPLDLGGQR